MNAQYEGKTIVSAKYICQAVKENVGFDVSVRLARKIIKKDIKLSCLKAKKLHPQANSEKNLYLM